MQSPPADPAALPAPLEAPDRSGSFDALLIEVRRHLHMYPEPGLREHRTSAFIREVLQRHGLSPVWPLAQTGLYVDIMGDHPGGCVGFRADMDALPIRDEKHVSYRSRNEGVAHLCGHDAHATVALGVALRLHDLRNVLHGTVRVFFQPNEEGQPSGAPLMIHDGVLDGVEAVYAVHVDPTLATGRYGLIAGVVTAAADRFRITVRGRQTGHSARPHQVTDTIWVATQIATALYHLIGRITDARNASVLTICQIRGGDADNVIPDRVTFSGTLRSTAANDRALIKKQIYRPADRADLSGPGRCTGRGGLTRGRQ
jgi:amidohydrolase